jgi:hypothetical protein
LLNNKQFKQNSELFDAAASSTVPVIALTAIIIFRQLLFFGIDVIGAVQHETPSQHLAEMSRKNEGVLRDMGCTC